MIIDAHHHLWRFDPLAYDWITPKDVPLRRDFVIPELRHMVAASELSGTIAVQARQTVEETRWLLGIAQCEPLIRGVVGWVPLADPELPRIVSELVTPQLVGVRHVVQGEIDPDFLLRPDILRGLKEISRRGLSYDLLIKARQLSQARRCVERCPELRFILDHGGKPDIRHRGLAQWQADLAALACLPNVACKLSGLVTEADPHTWTVAELEPYVRTILDLFGPQRVLFGSDWPGVPAGHHASPMVGHRAWMDPFVVGCRSSRYPRQQRYHLVSIGVPVNVLRITSPRQYEIVARPDPTPGPGEVMIRVAFIGLCGSDLSTWRGVNPLVSYPRIPGHEVSGTVISIGPGVTTAQVGDAVLAIPYTACNACSACKVGRFNCCRNNQTLGVQREGALGALLVLPETKILRVPGLDLTGLTLVEPLSVGFHAAARGRVTANDTVVVIGCGAVGIGAVAGAAARGAVVIAVDVDPGKLALAKRLGAAHTIDSQGIDLTATLSALDDGQGPSVLIEAVGNPTAFRACVDSAAFAGRVVYIGYAKEPVAYETKCFVQKELDIMGSRNATPADFAAAGAWLAQDPTRVTALISRVVPFAEAGMALDEWDKCPSSITKILIDCR